MIRDIVVISSLAIFGTLFFSFIIAICAVLVPLPFMILIVPLCLAGQLIFALSINTIAEWVGYKFKN